MVRGCNPLRYEREAEAAGDDTGWMDFVKLYFIPGMIVLAIVGVMLFQLSGSGDVSLTGTNNIFKDMGKAMFSLK